MFGTLWAVHHTTDGTLTKYVGFDWFQQVIIGCTENDFSVLLVSGCPIWVLGLGQFVELNIFFCKLTDTVKDMVFINDQLKGIVGDAMAMVLLTKAMNVSTIFGCWFDRDFHHLCFRYQLQHHLFGEYRRGHRWIEALQPFSTGAASKKFGANWFVEFSEQRKRVNDIKV